MSNTNISVKGDITINGLSGDVLLDGSNKNNVWSADDVEMFIESVEAEESFTEFINQ